MNNQWNWKGSRWWKFDFHTHTPKSSDFGKGPRQEEYQKINPQEWLLAFMKAGIDCVAITDHNSGEWVDGLKVALVELKEKNHPDFKEIYLFPGFEVSVNGGIHILGIFHPEKTSADIASILGKVGFSGNFGKCDRVTEKSCLQVVKEIVANDGIAIPAHVNASGGLFQEFKGITLAEIFIANTIIAMERIDKSGVLPSSYIEHKCDWVEVMGSDSHYPDKTDINHHPGSHYSWIKMETPTFEGLKLALLDGGLSVKRSDDVRINPNLAKNNAITKIRIKDAKYIGRDIGSEFFLEFNPWLNTIIGSRGTGKSTLLEFLRFGLERDNEIPDNLKPDIEKYRTVFNAYSGEIAQRFRSMPHSKAGKKTG